MDREALRDAVTRFLRAVGADLDDPHLRDTPGRVADAWADELLGGYRVDPADLLAGFAAARTEGEGAVTTTGIAYVSVCPHHLLPYPGVAHVAYLPGAREVGFSSLVRLVEAFGARLRLQEDMARDVARALMDHLGARGAAVLLEAQQMCMAVRGVRRHEARVTCTAFEGAFADPASPHRTEFQQAVAAWHAGRAGGGAG